MRGCSPPTTLWARRRTLHASSTTSTHSYPPHQRALTRTVPSLDWKKPLAGQMASELSFDYDDALQVPAERARREVNHAVRS